ncbi:thioredoxin family protein [Xanthovirga aplysinae]|uniref:thioredoxin family protein n=1 Tax=Xanthovirga aplysinae TaxID=2529853 RepID=UPI0012BBE754|nr:thioredoxin family protein [Xanthovirga aplysinae]MTI30486.1 hypothetical protein [Xanthovirga aplysinae]
MNIREGLIDFQNKAEKSFQEKKSLTSIINYIFAMVIFFSSTIFAAFTLPLRLIVKLFSEKDKGSSIQVMNSGNIDSILKKEKLVLIDFWAEWCGPCVMMNSTLQEFAENSENICIAKVNADFNRSIMSRFNVRGIPQFVLIKNGEEIKRHAGPMTLSDLEKFSFEGK